MFNFRTPSWADLMWAPGLVVGFTVHELAHAAVAFWMGDHSSLTRERLTLNPLKHIAWLGLAAFLLLGLGWAKPVQLRPGALKHTNLGSLLVALAGVTANACLGLLLSLSLLIATLTATAIATLWGWATPANLLNIEQGPLTPLRFIVLTLTVAPIIVNFSLAIFNLLPIPGLDGFHALVSLAGLVVRQQMPAARRRQAQAEAIMDEGHYFAARGHLGHAVNLWRAALQREPELPGAWHTLGTAYLRAGQTEAACGAFAQAHRTAQTPGQQRQLEELLRQAGWEGDELPAPLTGNLPDVAGVDSASAPPTPDYRAIIMRSLVGVAGGLVLYTGVVTGLLLLLARS